MPLAHAQDVATPGKILQDTTKSQADKKAKPDSVIYGPNTVRYLFETDLYLNQRVERYTDTTIFNRHRYSIIQRSGYNMQDLGVIGTAVAPVGYQAPERIGTRLGYEAYEAYQLNPSSISYIDTYSPYTDLDYVQGGKGRTRLRATHSRNVMPDWNVSATYQRMESNKIFGRISRRNDQQVVNQAFVVQNRFYTPNHRYKMLATFVYYEHRVEENGGYGLNNVSHDTITMRQIARAEETELFYRMPSNSARNIQNKRHFRLYHQYDFFSDSLRQERNQLQLFHTLDWTLQFNRYTDADAANNNETFYRLYQALPYTQAQLNTFRSGRDLRYATEFGQFDNKAGIKGKFGEFRYRAYARYRSMSYLVNYTDILTLGDSSRSLKPNNELYIGGGLDYTFKDSSRLETTLEQLLVNDYRISAQYKSRRFQLRHHRYFYRPALLQQQFLGSFYQWDNDFVNTLTDVSAAELGIKLPYTELRPFGSFTNVRNYVFFDSTGVARQAEGSTQLLQLGLKVQAQWRDFHNRSTFTFTRASGEDVLRVPTWQFVSQFYYERKLFNNALFGQLGIDLWWKSAFTANDYMPSTSQFILQNRFLAENYLVADVFFNFKIQRAMLFVKVANVLQDVVGKAYFNTPFYLAQPRSLELGINWLFFD